MSSLAPLLTITAPKPSSSSIAQPGWQGIFKRLPSLFSEETVSLKKTPSRLRAYPNNRLVMRPSEKSEAKAAGQKCLAAGRRASPEVVFSTLRTFLADNAGIGLPLGIERVIWIGS